MAGGKPDCFMNPFIADLADPGPLVPQAYAAYRPLVRDAFRFFLRRLAPRRAQAIASELLSMPPGTTLSGRLVRVLRRCPTLHKMGQVVARDPRLAPELRRRLQGLESLPPTVPAGFVREEIRREIGRVPGLEIGEKPLAEGSVAVVVPFRWRPNRDELRSGVFKLVKPGISERLEEELEILVELGPYLEDRCETYRLPPLDYSGTFEHVRDLLRNEVRLEEEQRNMAEASALYAGVPRVRVPQLFPFSTPRVTAMERVDGDKVTDVNGTEDEREDLASLAVEALLALPFWSEQPTTLFHADPHAGNLFLTDDRRLALLDWSLTVRLAKEQREQVVQIVLGGFTMDVHRVSRAVAKLARVRPGEEALRAAAGAALERVAEGATPGIEWVLGLLDSLATRGIVAFPRELVLFRKALFTVLQVVSDVSKQPVADRVMARVGTEKFWLELPWRGFAAPAWRGFGTHVSNLDLCELWLGWPWVAARRWGWARPFPAEPCSGPRKDSKGYRRGRRIDQRE